jgi:hypothetical protein
MQYQHSRCAELQPARREQRGHVSEVLTSKRRQSGTRAITDGGWLTDTRLLSEPGCAAAFGHQLPLQLCDLSACLGMVCLPPSHVRGLYCC